VGIALTGLALTAAVRVIDRVHDHAAHRRAHAEPAHRARLPNTRRLCSSLPTSPIVARQSMWILRIRPTSAGRSRTHLARGKLSRAAGAAHQLTALAHLQLDVVHRAADRNVPQWQRVARLDRSVRAGTDLIARLHALGSEDVASLAVLVEHEREVRGAVRIVFEPLHDARNAVLVALEIDDPVALLVTAADVAGGLAAGMVAGPVRFFLRSATRAARLVQVRAVDLDHEARARGGRSHLMSAMILDPYFAVPVKSIDWPACKRT